LLAAGLLPKPLEDQRRPDRPRTHGGRLAPLMRGQQQHRLTEPRPGAEQTLQLAALLELIESAQGGDDPLFGCAFLPAVFDDLQIRSSSRFLLAKEHGGLLFESP